MLSMVSTYREPSRCEFEEVEYCNGEIVRGLTDWGTLQVRLITIVWNNVIIVFQDLPKWKPQTALFTSLCLQKCYENV